MNSIDIVRHYALANNKPFQTDLKYRVTSTQPKNKQSFGQAYPQLWQGWRLVETNTQALQYHTYCPQIFRKIKYLQEFRQLYSVPKSSELPSCGIRLHILAFSQIAYHAYSHTRYAIIISLKLDLFPWPPKADYCFCSLITLSCILLILPQTNLVSRLN